MRLTSYFSQHAAGGRKTGIWGGGSYLPSCSLPARKNQKQPVAEKKGGPAGRALLLPGKYPFLRGDGWSRDPTGEDPASGEPDYHTASEGR